MLGEKLGCVRVNCVATFSGHFFFFFFVAVVLDCGVGAIRGSSGVVKPTMLVMGLSTYISVVHVGLILVAVLCQERAIHCRKTYVLSTLFYVTVGPPQLCVSLWRHLSISRCLTGRSVCPFWKRVSCASLVTYENWYCIVARYFWNVSNGICSSRKSKIIIRDVFFQHTAF